MGGTAFAENEEEATPDSFHDYTPKFAGLVRKLPELRKIRIDAPSAEMLGVIADLPFLTTLDVRCIRNEEGNKLSQRPIISPSFPSLRILEIGGFSAAAVASVFSRIQSLSLESPSIKNARRSSPSEWNNLLEALSLFPTPRTVKILELTESLGYDPADDYFEEHEAYIPVKDFVHRLERFAHVTTFKTFGNCGVRLSNKVVTFLCGIWKDLEALDLQPTYPRVSSATLAVIPGIIKACPKLRELRILMNARKSVHGSPYFQVDQSPSKDKCSNPVLNPENTAIKALSVYDSPITNPHAVAGFLLDIFLNLLKVQYSFSSDDFWEDSAAENGDIETRLQRYRKAWKTVNRLIGPLRVTQQVAHARQLNQSSKEIREFRIPFFIMFLIPRSDAIVFRAAK